MEIKGGGSLAIFALNPLQLGKRHGQVDQLWPDETLTLCQRLQ